jgi:hypothetical protein
MIFQSIWGITDHWIDAKRPDLTGGPEVELWKKFHNLVKTSSIPIITCAAWTFVEEMLETNQGYLGGGMAYKFWFQTLEDRNAFVEELAQVLPTWALTLKANAKYLLS